MIILNQTGFDGYDDGDGDGGDGGVHGVDEVCDDDNENDYDSLMMTVMIVINNFI